MENGSKDVQNDGEGTSSLLADGSADAVQAKKILEEKARAWKKKQARRFEKQRGNTIKIAS